MITLVVAAHPDDEVLGCGGTIARLAQAGHEVHIAILGEGLTSRYAQRAAADQAALEALRQHSRAAAKLLGAREVIFHDLPDNRFDTVPLLEVVKFIEGLLASLRPACLFTQHGGDLNIDHAVTFRAALTAARPLAGSPVKSIYAYEVASSTEWALQSFAPAFRANLFVDIAPTLELKLQALTQYESELRVFPHPRSPEALRSNAQRWGSVAGVQAAEAFEIVRTVMHSAGDFGAS